mgnify:CR=1 FL=1
MKRLVLFDIDGTLLTTDGAPRRAFHRAMLEVYRTTGPIATHAFDGKTDPQIARELLTHAGLPQAAVDRGEDVEGEYAEDMDMAQCIRLCSDCADVCEATARIATRQTRPDTRLVRATIEACAAACVACSEECDRHAAHHEHCRICADVCRRCKAACDEVLAF